MLYDRKQNMIKGTPHQEFYDLRRANLSVPDYQMMIKEIHRRMSERDVFAARDISEQHLQGTVFDPVCQACGNDEKEAGFFFGLLVKDAVQQHPDCWYLLREERDYYRLIVQVYCRKLI